MEALLVSLGEDGVADNDKDGFIEVDDSPTSEDESNDLKHDQMLDAVTAVGRRQRTSFANRTEASATVSEFATTNAGSKKLEVDDLLNSFGNIASLGDLRNRIEISQATVESLLPSLSPEYEKINREVVYKMVCKDVSKWDAIVNRNRGAHQLRFPLNCPPMRQDAIGDVVKRFKLSTPLELEMAAVLQNGDSTDDTDKNTDNEEVRHLSLSAALELRNEMRRIRLRQSYLASKFRRTKKIKSKSYHRILKKEILKKELKEFEELEKTNPEMAANKLEEMEKARALERMTQRHRNTGKWAKYHLLKTKYDKNGSSIQEQIELGRKLTAKKYISDSEDEPEQATTSQEPNPEEKNVELMLESFNPWLITKRNNTDVPRVTKTQAKVVGYRALWKEKNKMYQEKLEDAKSPEHSNDSNSHKELNVQAALHGGTTFDDESEIDEETKCSEEIDKIFSVLEKKKLSLTKINTTEKLLDEALCEKEIVDRSKTNETIVRKRTLEDFEGSNEDDPPSLLATSETESRYFAKSENITKKKCDDDNNVHESSDVSVDPQNFITVEQKVIKYKAPNIENLDEDAIEDSMEHSDANRMNIIEAFADDDVVEEFRKQKEDIIERNKPQSNELTLPGWGVWAGCGVSETPRKRLKEIKVPPPKKRKDSSLANVIINENANKLLEPYLVKEIPFPFSTTKEFEESIRAPVGKHWNPETVFERAIAPQIVTKLGKTIEPMNKEMLSKSSDNTTAVRQKKNFYSHK